MASTVKIILAVGGIFVAGAVTGGFVSLRVADHLAREKRAAQRMGPNEIGGRLAEQLNLTPEQRDKIKPIIGRASDELRKVRSQSFAQAAALVAKMDADMAKILTEEQRARLVEIRAREEERRKQWMAERAKRNENRENRAAGGPGGPGGGSPGGLGGAEGERPPPGGRPPAP
jgi:Spy/CpxP family protein refolding chaperone